MVKVKLDPISPADPVFTDFPGGPDPGSRDTGTLRTHWLPNSGSLPWLKPYGPGLLQPHMLVSVKSKRLANPLSLFGADGRT